MSRKFNFCAGPAALPETVLQQARDEMLDWQGKGLSVMEMSHRSDEFVSIANKAEADLRDLLNIPANYKVLFMQGGASSQFAMVPLNLGGKGGTGNYINTGIWGQKAIQEGERYLPIHLAASSSTVDGLVRVPRQFEIQTSQDAAYLHYTSNETIGGLEFDYVPTSDVPLVCDMSSDILSVPMDVSQFGLIYAGAQKNIGPAGLTLVIVRDDLLDQAKAEMPTMFSYKVCAENASMYNTPPTFALYLSGLVFDWLKTEVGGLENMAAINRRKAAKLYAAIDGNDFYSNPNALENRSIMNVPFRLADPSLDKLFLAKADDAGLLNLAGHRSVGGMRASIYNAVPEAAVDALIEFMNDFAKTRG